MTPIERVRSRQLRLAKKRILMREFDLSDELRAWRKAFELPEPEKRPWWRFW